MLASVERSSGRSSVRGTRATCRGAGKTYAGKTPRDVTPCQTARMTAATSRAGSLRPILPGPPPARSAAAVDGAGCSCARAADLMPGLRPSSSGVAEGSMPILPYGLVPSTWAIRP
jgi:hypothetical protein